ncbi:MAG: hypothetical protein WDO17_16120 [Alphaproteobacteria bacterium]
MKKKLVSACVLFASVIAFSSTGANARQANIIFRFITHTTCVWDTITHAATMDTVAVSTLRGIRAPVLRTGVAVPARGAAGGSAIISEWPIASYGLRAIGLRWAAAREGLASGQWSYGRIMSGSLPPRRRQVDHQERQRRSHGARAPALDRRRDRISRGVRLRLSA